MAKVARYINALNQSLNDYIYNLQIVTIGKICFGIKFKKSVLKPIFLCEILNFDLKRNPIYGKNKHLRTYIIYL